MSIRQKSSSLTRRIREKDRYFLNKLNSEERTKRKRRQNDDNYDIGLVFLSRIYAAMFGFILIMPYLPDWFYSTNFGFFVLCGLPLLVIVSSIIWSDNAGRENPLLYPITVASMLFFIFWFGEDPRSIIFPHSMISHVLHILFIVLLLGVFIATLPKRTK
ncbi:MAG: hypothetical protein J7J93_01090 [Candidatus Aenigmarchaeota archaeon]|nr:hypothetical protein [Candidatus Aenigmarchaeota archaeon]